MSDDDDDDDDNGDETGDGYDEDDIRVVQRSFQQPTFHNVTRDKQTDNNMFRTNTRSKLLKCRLLK